MLLRPRRPPPLAPHALPSPSSPDVDLRPAEDGPGTPLAGPATPSALAEPESPRSPVSPGSAQRTPWSARETELLLGTLLQPTVWRSLLLDRRQAQPTYRRVSAALARQQVRRTPAQCRRRYKFLKDKLRDAQGQPSGPFDAQIRELMGLLGDHGRRRVRRRPPGPGRPQRGRRRTPAVPTRFLEEPGRWEGRRPGRVAWGMALREPRRSRVLLCRRRAAVSHPGPRRRSRLPAQVQPLLAKVCRALLRPRISDGPCPNSLPNLHSRSWPSPRVPTPSGPRSLPREPRHPALSPRRSRTPASHTAFAKCRGAADLNAPR